MTKIKFSLTAFSFFIACSLISWAITCSVIYLICLCFSLNFSLLVATGVWLCTIFVRQIFK
ncbi:hypothetical protein MKA27_13165 [[Clostridium] innocuum]|uniref:hypothetical protein n=1 Tax=Clostridium innocuum TaxID=1522 RepID=UPI000D6BE524|nr:hypothetical protein [[Clostridium] innocuum]MCR0315258.1 hypothetical protein [[Clostridium] innocuum]MCR0369720.1 hypothetical protein [[Clostridium] innocuum]MCR0374769.1 hypothetical protein [[Clostridium] innocuum]MCR0559673.1 hypothetical protein [[Clostridium] innocuum]MCR0602633.1 hypothetical protein [[Clostridium] innocuum]